MNFTKKKSFARTQVNEFGATTALVEAAKSDVQASVTEIHLVADSVDIASIRSAAGLAIDGAHAQPELTIVPLSPGLAIDKGAPLQANSPGSGFDSGKLLSSVYVDQSGGWGLQLAPDNVPDASEQAVSGADEKVLEAEVLELEKPVIKAAMNDAGAAGEIDDGGTTADATPTFSGYGEPFARLTIYDNGLPIGDTAIGSDGIWSFTVRERLDPGEHQFIVDVAGVMSDPFMLTVSAPEADRPAIDAVPDDAGAVAELISGDTASDSCPALSGLVLADLLQPATAELLAGGQAGILPGGGSAQVLDLSNKIFDSGLPADVQSPAAAHAALPVQMMTPAELWQSEAAT
ncbi:hypothetical protein BCF11_0489 [Collimonas sp. PA-H2]|uniref:Ig-like domain-containing protein n=1 Tax=Collimonas sp. PA-H2 TaxID=1881062 RepID=UPI000BF75E49|nr:Ig-like domain-containing protein [Collimonas sp. PA-H2]PFH08137.1 hypothetical protein BCF11_0489 [Collimonas sp. PA-H2]